ncbi:MAG TPA: cytochrome P450 [Roseiflexaceae bacterium]|nr:cytochrome P450 [Roseiflexaceae bacterium]
MSGATTSSLLTPAFFADPYPTYHELQQHDPLHWSEAMSAWYVTRYRDVLALLREPRLSNNRTAGLLRGLSPEELQEFEPLRKFLNHWLVFTDPPTHTRLRALLTRVFPPRLTEAMRPKIVALLDELLDAAAARGQLQVMNDLAYPLPAFIVGELLGARREDRELIRAWSDDMILFGPGRYTTDTLRLIQNAFVNMTNYFAEILDSGRTTPDTITHQLLQVEAEGERLDRDELLAICTMMMFAGHETTMNLVANGILTLLRHPDQLRLLQNNPELIEPCVEELLRYESPVQNISRSVLEDFEYGGVTIRKGQRVVLSVGAANRDPEQFNEPDRFDIQRNQSRHLSFAYGIHFCLGAPLARMEGQLALSTLLQRFPKLHAPDQEITWKPLMLVREMTEMTVELQ